MPLSISWREFNRHFDVLAMLRTYMSKTFYSNRLSLRSISQTTIIYPQFFRLFCENDGWQFIIIQPYVFNIVPLIWFLQSTICAEYNNDPISRWSWRPQWSCRFWNAWRISLKDIIHRTNLSNERFFDDKNGSCARWWVRVCDLKKYMK